jgi:hypothetical protein
MSLRVNHRRRTDKNEEQNRLYSVKTGRHVSNHGRDKKEEGGRR